MDVLRPPSGLDEIVRVFILWKSLLLLVTSVSPGPGYDTSTDILMGNTSDESTTWLASVIEHVTLRLTRWDAIYFANSSRRGHVHEQEWAFSWALSRFTSVFAIVLGPLKLRPLTTHAIAGIIVSHITHLLAAIVLFKLTHELLLHLPARHRLQIAVITAVLFIISPAGIFLSAPYGESTFAFLSFCGILSYVFAIQNRLSADGNGISNLLWTLMAGIFFALASMIRGNGLLNGIIFLWDALDAVSKLLRNPHSLDHLHDLMLNVAAGLILATGFVLPQAVAYFEYCASDLPRPWCHNIPPSIYSFVQLHYWNVGFLRYWTLPNLPLFLLAFPVCTLMVATAWRTLLSPSLLLPMNTTTIEQKGDFTKSKLQIRSTGSQIFAHVLCRLALIQLILVIMALTSFHCQIINRISSGYPLWYLIIALDMSYQQISPLKGSDSQGCRLSPFAQKWTVRGFVLFATVQGGLYSSFLPPA